jgi:hypothetical protein
MKFDWLLQVRPSLHRHNIANAKKKNCAEKNQDILIKYAEINLYIYRKSEKIVHGEIHL